MVNVQKWLDENYPKEERKEIIELDISKEPNTPDSEKLQGELDLSDFVSLERLNCRFNKFTSISLDNCSKLKELNCSYNQLTSLNISNLVNLNWLDCYDNYLTNINYPSNSERLTFLSVGNNNFPTQDCSVFSQFTNLEELWISNDYEPRIEKGIYNRFLGSLKFLKDLSKLRTLNISDTDINSGVEYLPDNIQTFYCLAKKKKDSQVRIIYNLFANEKGEVEANEHGEIENFPTKFWTYKEEKKTQARKLLKDEFQSYERQIEEQKEQLAQKEKQIQILEVENNYLKTQLSKTEEQQTKVMHNLPRNS